MRRRIRQLLDSEDKAHAIADVHLWGYPRALVEDEMKDSAWFRYGPDSIFWLQPFEAMEATCALHVAVAPSSQSRHGIAPRFFLQAVDVIADLYCLRHLIATDCIPGGPVAGYLQRLGWEQREIPMLQDGESGWWIKDFPPFSYELEGDQDEQAAPPEDDRRCARG